MDIPHHSSNNKHPAIRQRSCSTSQNPSLYRLQHKQDYVRLSVTDTAVGMDLLSMLRQVYPHLLVVSGKNYEKGESTITLTIAELEEKPLFLMP